MWLGMCTRRAGAVRGGVNSNFLFFHWAVTCVCEVAGRCCAAVSCTTRSTLTRLFRRLLLLVMMMMVPVACCCVLLLLVTVYLRLLTLALLSRWTAWTHTCRPSRWVCGQGGCVGALQYVCVCVHVCRVFPRSCSNAHTCCNAHTVVTLSPCDATNTKHTLSLFSLLLSP